MESSFTPAGLARACPTPNLSEPLVVDKMPLDVPPPRGGRFGSPLVLSRVHWVRPEMVVGVCYVEWTSDGLLRHVVYLGEREDKPAIDVRRDPPHAG
jgi:bifunctional non-homologous end joining protein LigD